MIIKYRLADGQIVDVDVSREVAEALAEWTVVKQIDTKKRNIIRKLSFGRL